MDNCGSTSSASYAEKISQSLFYSKKAVQLHGWLDIALCGLMPINIVGNPVFVLNVRHLPIHYSILMNYMDRLTTHVEEKITKILPSKFGLLADGWFALDTHYLAVFATFFANTET